MLAAICLATIGWVGQGVDLESDARLKKSITLHEEIISLADLGAELNQMTGVPVFVRHRVADRKVTIVFKDRPAAEAMNRLATCMLMSWQRTTGNGYELDFTGEAAAAEARTESLERERARSGLRDAVREIRRLSDLSPQGRIAEKKRLDEE